MVIVSNAVSAQGRARYNLYIRFDITGFVREFDSFDSVAQDSASATLLPSLCE